MFLMFYLTKCSANYGELISQSTEVIQNSESLSPEIARVIKITESGREEGVINFSRADDEELVPAIEIYNGTRTELGWNGYASTVRIYGGCHTQYLINNILTFFCRGDLYSIDATTGDRVGALQVMGDEDNYGDFVYFKDDIFVVTGDYILSLDGEFSEKGGIVFVKRNPNGTFTELKSIRIPDMFNNSIKIEIINDNKLIIWVGSGAQITFPENSYNPQYANYMTAYVIDNITINGDNITHSPVDGPYILDTAVGNISGRLNRLYSKPLTDEITVRAYYKNRGQDTLIAVSLVNKTTEEEVQSIDPETEAEKLALWGDSIVGNSGLGEYLTPYISIEELENGNKIVSLLYVGREDRYVISVFNFNKDTNKLEQIGNYPLGYLGDYPSSTSHKSGTFLKTKAAKDASDKAILVLDGIYPYKFTTGSPTRRASMNQDTLTIDLETGIVLSSTSTTTSTTTTTPTTDAETTAATTTTTSSSSSSTNPATSSLTNESSTTEAVSSTRTLEITSTTVDNTTGEVTSTFTSTTTEDASSSRGTTSESSSSTTSNPGTTTTFTEERTNSETGVVTTVVTTVNHSTGEVTETTYVSSTNGPTTLVATSTYTSTEYLASKSGGDYTVLISATASSVIALLGALGFATYKCCTKKGKVKDMEKNTVPTQYNPLFGSRSNSIGMSHENPVYDSSGTIPPNNFVDPSQLSERMQNSRLYQEPTPVAINEDSRFYEEPVVLNKDEDSKDPNNGYLECGDTASTNADTYTVDELPGNASMLHTMVDKGLNNTTEYDYVAPDRNGPQVRYDSIDNSSDVYAEPSVVCNREESTYDVTDTHSRTEADNRRISSVERVYMQPAVQRFTVVNSTDDQYDLPNAIDTHSSL